MKEDTVRALDKAAEAGRERVGGKAANLAVLAAAGFAVPPGLIIADAAYELPDEQLRAALDAVLGEVADTASDVWPGLAAGPFAVRSSAAAEDLAEASYAGLYETFLNVSREGLVEAAHRCHAAASSTRVTAYQSARTRGGAAAPGAAVLVQPMVHAVAAGVAFTANPVTGDRAEAVVTAVPGLGERLVSGQAAGDEWTVRGDRAERRHRGADTIGAEQARSVADLARRVEAHFGVPQDIEWAIAGEQLWLLQARPMTALPDPVDWTPPGPGLWMRNFRLGEWLPDPVTPLFASWLLHRIEAGYLAGMRGTVGTTVPFRYAVVNGWYYNALPIPSPQLLARALAQSRGRIVPVLYNALARVSRNPAAADKAVLTRLYRQWGEEHLPRYRRLVAAAETEVGDADSRRLIDLVDALGHAAGQYLWFLAIVGGSAWKIEGRLGRFCRDYLCTVDAVRVGVQVLLRGLPGTEPATPPHAVHSADWYHPTAGEHPEYEDTTSTPEARGRHRALAVERRAAERACRAALTKNRRGLAQFDALLDVAQRYAVIREEQARDLTLAWPVLRRCAHCLGKQLQARGQIRAIEDVFFLTRAELDSTTASYIDIVATRQEQWRQQKRLTPPLTLGTPPRLIGDPIAKAVQQARGAQAIPEGAIVGQPASAGRAAGRIRLIEAIEQFDQFAPGEVLLAKATAPAWTPLFARAAAVITDGGTLAAHASLVAREYGIPAVVGTGNATSRLRTGQHAVVDGTTGIITTTATHQAG